MKCAYYALFNVSTKASLVTNRCEHLSYQCFSIGWPKNDQINDQINDLGLLILQEIKKKPGIKVPGLVESISSYIPDVNADKVRNEIKRELRNYIELRGSRKTGGYYLKQKWRVSICCFEGNYSQQSVSSQTQFNKTISAPVFGADL